MRDEVCKYIETLVPELTELRHCIHMNPEIAMTEYATSKSIKEMLDKHGVPCDYITEDKLGVHLTIDGGQEGDTILLRSDIDCLPLTEDNDLPFKSKNPGLMHACGHDMHSSFLVGAAITLYHFKEQLKGRVKIVFQPAEEALGGAKVVLAAGILDGLKIKYGYALHCTGVDVGKVKISMGNAMAASDTFDITVKGLGGHAASQERTVDPIIISGHVVTALQHIAARNRHPSDPLVLSITKINGGTAYNVTPAEVTMGGTVRSFNEEFRQNMPELMTRICRSTAQAFGGDCDVKYNFQCPALISDPEMFAATKAALTKSFGTENLIINSKPGMGSEDFAYYQPLTPCMQIGIGTASEKYPNSYLPVHNPNVIFDDDAMFYGIKTGCSLVLDQE